VAEPALGATVMERLTPRARSNGLTLSPQTAEPECAFREVDGFGKKLVAAAVSRREACPMRIGAEASASWVSGSFAVAPALSSGSKPRVE